MGMFNGEALVDADAELSHAGQSHIINSAREWGATGYVG